MYCHSNVCSASKAYVYLFAIDRNITTSKEARKNSIIASSLTSQADSKYLTTTYEKEVIIFCITLDFIAGISVLSRQVTVFKTRRKQFLCQHFLCETRNIFYS